MYKQKRAERLSFAAFCSEFLKWNKICGMDSDQGKQGVPVVWEMQRGTMRTLPEDFGVSLNT